MRNFIARTSTLLLLLLLVACDRGGSTQGSTQEDALPVSISESDASEAEEPLEPADDAPAAEDEGDAADQNAENTEDSADDEHADADDQKVQVRAIPFDAQKFPSELPLGRVEGGVAFIDSAGVNHVVFTVDEPYSRNHVRRGAVYIKHVVENDGVTREVRSYVERIDDCDVDVIIRPFFGDWSVSDVDNNGVGEVSFGYTADCVSDYSPFIHKVFVTEAGKKYALRGHTLMDHGEDGIEGGTYIADRMPPLFLRKAKKVWNLTSPH